jgi:CBS domain-containing protein
VDGGVNGEVSFILRNMGVSSSVSGSYLFNAPSIGHALMNLTKREIESQYTVGDFMIPLVECPKDYIETCTTKSILEAVENGNFGFTLMLDQNNQFKGIVSSADIRKALLRKIDKPSEIIPQDLINSNPIKITANSTVVALLQLIKKCNFPVMYFPVVDEAQNAVGIINFVHLIKGEI